MSLNTDLQKLHSLRALVEVRERQARLENEAGIVFYRPHPKQDLFHRAGVHAMRFVRTGNRFGKSTAGAIEDISWCLGYRPFYPEGDEARYAGIPQRPVKGLIIVADWDKAEEIFTCEDEGASRGKLFQFLPRSEILGIEKNQSGKIAKIRIRSIWGGESAIHLDTVKSFKSNPMGHESSDWDFVHVDEPCPEAMWQAHARGLVDRDGNAWFMCTPLTEIWINDKFVPGGNFRDAFESGKVFEKEEAGIKLQSWVLTGSMHDNPTLSAIAKARYILDLPPEDRETRIDGIPRALTGVVYREFQPHVHVYHNLPPKWLDYGDPPRDYTIRIAADTHPKNPHAVLFAATAPSSRVYFWSEIYEQALIPELCNRIHERLDGRWPLRFLLELAAFNDIPTDGVTIADLFVNAGFPVEAATKDLSFGIMRVKSELTQRMDNVPDKPAKLLFSPHLTETLREFDRYVWDPDKGKPMDRDDHMMENLYRLVLTGLEYVSPQPYVIPKFEWNTFNDVNLGLPEQSLALPGQTVRKSRSARLAHYPSSPPSISCPVPESLYDEEKRLIRMSR